MWNCGYVEVVWCGGNSRNGIIGNKKPRLAGFNMWSFNIIMLTKYISDMLLTKLKRVAIVSIL